MADELITVARFEFVPEAEAARMHLEGEGIRTFIADGGMVTADWFLGNAIGYVKLQVPASQAGRAREMLDGLRALKRQREGDETERREPAACLACGAELPVAAAACAACGWSYGAGDDVAQDDAAEDDEGGSDDEPATGMMDRLRSLRRPIFWLMLAPTLVMVGFGLIALVVMILSALIG